MLVDVSLDSKLIHREGHFWLFFELHRHFTLTEETITPKDFDSTLLNGKIFFFEIKRYCKWPQMAKEK